MTQFIVVGAGMAGLLAAGILRSNCLSVIEAQEMLPNNHSAVLRFRTQEVAKALDIQFKAVKVMKAVQPWQNPIADAISYSIKTNGTASLRSSISGTGEVCERFIAPLDLIQQMRKAVTSQITFGLPFTADMLVKDRPAIISTLPMPMLMDLLGWKEKPLFKSVQGLNANFYVKNADVYASLYVPDPEIPFSRVSITGEKVTVEMPSPGSTREEIAEMHNYLRSSSMLGNLCKHALHMMGFDDPEFSDPVLQVQKYAKILPIDEKIRKRFIMWASEEHHIYSLGRFATWRPGLLLDDVVKDVMVIRRIASEGNYDHKRGL